MTNQLTNHIPGSLHQYPAGQGRQVKFGLINWSINQSVS